MKILFIDTSYGISGDMTVAAMLDMGMPFEYLENELKKLNLDNFEISRKTVLRSGITATHFTVHDHSHNSDHHHHRHLKDIEKIITESSLKDIIKKVALEMFDTLATVEAAVHNTTKEKIHFHEVGAIDSIIDIISACIGFDYFSPQQVISTPVNLGSGKVKTAHGLLPVPPPAVVELVKGISTYGDDSGYELTTPTGALILKTFVDSFSQMPIIKSERIGYGAGTREIEGKPNLLRMILGETEASENSLEDKVYIIETEVDDMTGEALGYLMDRTLEAGALDVYYTNIQMKKNRPGILITILSKEENLTALKNILFNETTTLGLRIRQSERVILKREIVKVKTVYGDINVKVANTPDGNIKIGPEYEDCAKAALQNKVPLKKVYEEVIESFNKRKK